MLRLLRWPAPSPRALWVSQRALSATARAEGVSGRLAEGQVALSRRVRESQPLLIKEIAAEVAAHTAAGHRLVNLSQGVPCLPIFAPAADRMVEAVRAMELPYSPVAGFDSVRSTAARFVNHVYGIGPVFGPENVIVTAGGIQACFLAFSLVVEGASDVVLASLPAYSIYQAQAAYFGGTFVTVPSGAEGQPSGASLRAAFEEQRRADRRIRAVALCTPNNPTGRVLTRRCAEELAAALEEELDLQPDGFLVLLDEVYLGVESEAHVSLLQVASPRLRRRLCLVLSASKGLGAMPGARAGWLTVGDPALAAEMLKVLACASANASTVAQVGLQASLEECMRDPSVLQGVYSYYAKRTAFMAKELNAVTQRHGLGSVCSEPQGTFYLWVDFSGLREAGDDTQLYRRLLEDGVAVVPGSAFAMDPALRLLRVNCARDSFDDLRRAVEAFDRTLTQLLAA